MPESLLHHYLVRSLNTVHDSPEIYIQDFIPLFDPVMIYTAADGDAGVVEHIVQSADAGDGFMNHSFHSRKNGDIDLSGSGFASR